MQDIFLMLQADVACAAALACHPTIESIAKVLVALQDDTEDSAVPGCAAGRGQSQ
jgi:hypothetical protein